jgi:hypothetical protein
MMDHATQAEVLPQTTGFRLRLFVFASSLSVVLLCTYYFQLNSLGKYLDSLWQFADLSLLKQSPLTAALYLHAQPPLMNFIAGILGFLGLDVYGWLTGINAFCIAAASVIVFDILQTAGLSRNLALGVITLFNMAPAVLLNVSYPFYPCLSLLGYAMLLHALIISQKCRRISAVYLCVAAVFLSLLRSSFTPLHAIFFVCVWNVMSRHTWRPDKVFIQLALSVAFLVNLVPMKNTVLYGFWGSSSWTPMNIASGWGIDLAPLGPFPAPGKIRETYPELNCTGYTAIDSADNRSSGSPNYNSCFMIKYAQIVRGEIAKKYSFRTHAHKISRHLAYYMSVPDLYFQLRNREQIAPYADFMSVVAGAMIIGNTRVRFGTVIVTLLGLWLFRKEKKLVVVPMSILLIVHLLTHVLTDGNEGDRFVFDVEFIPLICLGLVLNELGRRFQRMRIRSKAES